MSSTSIKMVGGVSARDARSFSQEMQCDVNDIRAVKKHDTYSEWMCYVRNVGTGKVISNFLALENMPKKSEQEYQALINKNRERYSVRLSASSETTYKERKEPILRAVAEEEGEYKAKEENNDKGGIWD